jgi:hypothetical protein
LITLCITEIVTRGTINQLANQEVIFYFERLFEPIVVATLRRTLKNITGPYELVPSQCFNVVDIAQEKERMKQAMTLRFDHVKMVLSENKKRFAPGVEFLGRKVKGGKRAEEIPLYVYHECAIEGCTDMCMLDVTCSECGIRTCSQPEHKEHASHVGLVKSATVTATAAASPVQPEKKKAQKRGAKKQPVAEVVPVAASPSLLSSSSTATNSDQQLLRSELNEMKAQLKELKALLSLRSSEGGS